MEALLRRLNLPPDWRTTILAYYLHAGGPDAVEWQTHNLRQSLQRLLELFKRGHLGFEQQTQALRRERETLRPSAHPAAAALESVLADFPARWQQILPDEKRRILSVVFAGLYVDAQARVLAHEPFDRLLHLPADGLMVAAELQLAQASNSPTPPGH